MTKPQDTRKMDPALILAMAMGDRMHARPQGAFIEDMEADGQRQLLHSTSLPTEINGGVRLPQEERRPLSIDEARKREAALTDDVLRAWGFRLGEPDPEDPLFREATLPAGWRRRGSDHVMWSYIDDDQGRERIAIFYKAAFYDRRAHMDLCRRYVARVDYASADTSECFGVVKEGERVLWRGSPIADRPWPKDPEAAAVHVSADEDARKEAFAWAHANLPAGWDDLVKAWDL